MYVPHPRFRPAPILAAYHPPATLVHNSSRRAQIHSKPAPINSLSRQLSFPYAAVYVSSSIAHVARFPKQKPPTKTQTTYPSLTLAFTYVLAPSHSDTRNTVRIINHLPRPSPLPFPFPRVFFLNKRNRKGKPQLLLSETGLSTPSLYRCFALRFFVPRVYGSIL